MLTKIKDFTVNFKIQNLLKHKNFIAFISGALLSLAFVPIYFFPAVFISLSVFYLLLEKEIAKKSATKKEVFYLGFAFGFGHFLTGIYWISISLLVDAEKFAWLIPFALTLIPGVLAIYFGVFALLYFWVNKKLSFKYSHQKIILFALLWLFVEILRSNLLSGFPWNLLGYVWMFNLNFAQIASIFGVYGLSLFAVLVALLPVLFWKRKAQFSDKIYAALVILFLCGNFLFGYFHIDDSKIIADEKIKIRLVQADVKQDLKWNGEDRYRNFLKHIALTNSADPKDLKAVIWSESSVPYLLNKSPQLLEYTKYAVPQNGVLITGALRMKENVSDKKDVEVWNSIFVLNEKGISDFYDKHHLVPFGEYVPFHQFLSFLFLDSVVDQITGGGRGFSEGKGAQTINLEGFSFSPLVCYEAIFSSKVIDKKNIPDVFVNLTNDAWFGNSSGPYQHFDMTRMRAIEYGIPLIRVANTGITAFVDPFGRVISQLPRNKMAIEDITLVKSNLNSIYLRLGNLCLQILTLTLSLMLVTHLMRKNAKTNYSN